MRCVQQSSARNSLKYSRLALQIALVLLVALTVAAENRPAEPILQGEGSLKVMTYNMYVGTEYGAGLTTPNYDNFMQAVSDLFVDVRASEPQLRARAIARQIAATRPHLVSLQEVATWSSGPSPSSMETEFDFLQLLLDELAAQGMSYTAAASLTHFDVTLPTTTGAGRNTWRVIILARADLKAEDFSLTNVQTAPWSNACTYKIPIPAMGIILPFPRGWASADVTYRGKQIRFIAAHLESMSASKNICEGVELLNGPANTSLPVIIAADLNCDLANSGDTKYPTCLNFLNAGFVDAWTAANPDLPGYTKDLPSMTKRGDYVMVRGRFGVQAAALVGEKPADMAAPGLWPSNHCGVVARLQLPQE